MYEDHVPHHVAITPDGNGRWAQRRGLPRSEGHRRGARALQDVIGGALGLGVRFLSLHAFSTENWKRPASEVADLMDVYADYLAAHRTYFENRGVRVRLLGSRERIPERLVREIETTEHVTRNNDRLTFVMCVDYGGRSDLLRAVDGVAEDARNGTLPDAPLDERTFARYLNRFDLPDVDLLLRSGGETRTSNFYLWQTAFSELAFLDKPWPDVTAEDLRQAVSRYASRERTLGGLGRQGR